MVQGVVIEDNHIVDCNPATNEEIARVKCATADEISGAVENAKSAQAEWAEYSLEERVALVNKACSFWTSDEGEELKMAELVTREMGKIPEEAAAEVEGLPGKDYVTLVAKANEPETVEENGKLQAKIFRAPVGVVAVIAPWNFPVGEIPLLVVPALVAGNAVIVKPSEVTPLCGQRVVERMQKAFAESPPLRHLLQVLQGDGEVGSQLVSHSKVNMVAMTGSSATGKRIMTACGSDLKRLVLELGGKDPMVVFGDAELEKAAEDAVVYSLENCGQVCCSVERVYVEEKILPDFEKLVVEKTKAFLAGDPAGAGSGGSRGGVADKDGSGGGGDADAKNKTNDIKLGPMVSLTQKKIVQSHVADAVASGAKLLYQGDWLANAQRRSGADIDKYDETSSANNKCDFSHNFYPATVVSGVKQDMKIAREETFGPVITLIPFDGSEKEAVKLANDTEYGLSASVYSGDVDRAARVASRIEAGQVGVNGNAIASAPAVCPWAGAKGSGFGYHSGNDGWRQFSVPRSVIF